MLQSGIILNLFLKGKCIRQFHATTTQLKRKGGATAHEIESRTFSKKQKKRKKDESILRSESSHDHGKAKIKSRQIQREVNSSDMMRQTEAIRSL